jgi:phage FluMu protein gp41
VIAIAVEAIESWIIASQSLVTTGHGSLMAEREMRSTFKRRLYGRPAATLEDVESVALPIIRSLTSSNLATLRQHVRSFDDFAQQIAALQQNVIVSTPCT